MLAHQFATRDEIAQVVAELSLSGDKILVDETQEYRDSFYISAATNPMAEHAMEQLDKLRGCEVHSSVILSSVDERTFKRLGVNLTCEPRYMG